MITLPHSGLSVPHTDLRVVELREVTHAYGVAVTGVLQFGQCIVGVAENDGLGGQTTFLGPGDYFAWRDLEAFTAQCRHGGKRVNVGEVLDCLVDEYDFARRLAQAARRWRTLARTVVLDRYPENNVVEVDPPATAEQRAVLTAHLTAVPVLNGARWEMWDGQRWTALIEPMPPTDPA